MEAAGSYTANKAKITASHQVKFHFFMIDFFYFGGFNAKEVSLFIVVFTVGARLESLNYTLTVNSAER